MSIKEVTKWSLLAWHTYNILSNTEKWLDAAQAMLDNPSVETASNFIFCTYEEAKVV